MAGGWIKLHRSILDWRWYGDQNTRIVFIHLLLTANHKDKAWRGITIRQGQRAVSYEGLAEELQLSVQNVRTAIKHLKSTGELTSHLTGSCPIITIQNYGKYQALYSEGEEAVEGGLTGNLTPNLTGSQQAANRLLTPNKNIKKERTKEDKKREYAPAVHLTEEEYQKIVETVGEEGAAWCIQKLSGHKEAKGTKYKSDMGAMRKWVFDAWDERKRGPTSRGTGKESNIQRNDRVIDEYIWDYEQGGRNGQEADCTIIEAHKPELPGK